MKAEGLGCVYRGTKFHIRIYDHPRARPDDPPYTAIVSIEHDAGVNEFTISEQADAPEQAAAIALVEAIRSIDSRLDNNRDLLST